MFPSQVGDFANLQKNAIDGVIVFIDLSGKVLFRVLGPRIGDFVGCIPADFVGFSYA